MGQTYIYPPVSVTTLPPIGGATSANQVLEIAELQDINSELDQIYAELAMFSNENMTNLLAIGLKLDSIIANSGIQTGSFDEKIGFVAVQTFTAPANATGGNIMNVGSGNVRYKQGGVAAIASGLRLEPGRSEQILNGSSISVISEDGTTACDVAIIWNIKP